MRLRNTPIRLLALLVAAGAASALSASMMKISPAYYAFYSFGLQRPHQGGGPGFGPGGKFGSSAPGSPFGRPIYRPPVKKQGPPRAGGPQSGNQHVHSASCGHTVPPPPTGQETVPEPATLGMMGGALLLAGWLRRRRNRR